MAQFSQELMQKLLARGDRMSNQSDYTDQEMQELRNAGVNVSHLGDFDTGAVLDTIPKGTQDQSTLDRSSSVLGRLGLSDEAVKRTYDEYRPQDVAEREEFGQARGVLDDLHNEASSTGLSRWGQASEDRQRLGEQSAQEQLNKRTAGQQAGMFSRMAQSGGLDSGSRERMAGAMGREQMFGSQGIARQGMEQRAGISETDMGRKQDTMGQLPSMFSSLGGQRQAIDNYNMDRKDRFAQEERQARLGARDKGAELFGGFKTNEEQV